MYLAELRQRPWRTRGFTGSIKDRARRMSAWTFQLFGRTRSGTCEAIALQEFVTTFGGAEPVFLLVLSQLASQSIAATTVFLKNLLSFATFFLFQASKMAGGPDHVLWRSPHAPKERLNG